MQCEFVHFVERDVAALQRGVHVTQDRVRGVLERHARHRHQAAFLHPQTRSQPHLAEDEVQDARALVRVVAGRRVLQAVDVLERLLADGQAGVGITGCAKRQQGWRRRNGWPRSR